MGISPIQNRTAYRAWHYGAHVGYMGYLLLQCTPYSMFCIKPNYIVYSEFTVLYVAMITIIFVILVLYCEQA